MPVFYACGYFSAVICNLNTCFYFLYFPVLSSKCELLVQLRNNLSLSSNLSFVLTSGAVIVESELSHRLWVGVGKAEGLTLRSCWPELTVLCVPVEAE